MIKGPAQAIWLWLSQHRYYLSIAVITFVLCLLADRERRSRAQLRVFGYKAPAISSKWPFGLGTVYQALTRAGKGESLLFWDNLLRPQGAERALTVEGSVAGKRAIFTVDPENIDAILRLKFKSFGKGPKFNSDWWEFLGNGIFATDGERWREGRKLLTSVFVLDRINIPLFARHVEVLVRQLDRHQGVDVIPLMFGLTLDIATDFLLGGGTQALLHPRNDFALAFEYIQDFHMCVTRMGPLSKLKPRGELRRRLKVFNGFVEPFVHRALDAQEKMPSELQHTFLAAVAGYTRDRQVIRDQIVSVLLAARDTTACTLSWLMYELAHAPELVEELRAEIFDKLGPTKQPTLEDLKGLTLLQNSISEALRIYPVLPTNIRVALEDASLPRGGGSDGVEPVGVLKDTPVFYSTQYLQLSEEVYADAPTSFPDPALFEPHRWEHWEPPAHTYVPFNAGRRLCTGQQFALAEIAFTVVEILRAFRTLEPCGSMRNPREVPKEETLIERVLRSRVRMKTQVVLRPAEPLHIRFHR